MNTNLNNLKNKKLFMLDMDGTIYLGNRLYDATLEFLDTIKKRGGKYIFMTNNSSKSVDAYIKKLGTMGIDACEDDFFTSSMATAIYLKQKYTDEKIYVLGTQSLKSELKSHGFNITDKLEDGIKCLLMGFDTELAFSKLEDACILLGRGVDYIATNPDLVCPTEYGYVPDCGSVADMLYNATKKRPLYIGKPQPEMPLLASRKFGFSKEESVVIGDRIYTDVACGINAGIDSVFVLSGEGVMSDIEKFGISPDYVAGGIEDILKVIK